MGDRCLRRAIFHRTGLCPEVQRTWIPTSAAAGGASRVNGRVFPAHLRLLRVSLGILSAVSRLTSHRLRNAPPPEDEESIDIDLFHDLPLFDSDNEGMDDDDNHDDADDIRML